LSYSKVGDLLKRRFKAKKKSKIIKNKYLIYFIIILGISVITFQYVNKLKFASNNEEFIKYLLEDANHFKEYDSSVKKIVYKVSKTLTGVDTEEPVSILENKFLFKSNKKDIDTKLAYKDNEKEEVKPLVENKGEVSQTNKVVYIYNTHQVETYNPGNLKEFNITPDVVMASYIIKDRLEKKGIKVIFEERKMSEYLKNAGLDYDHSYTASRYYLKDVLKNNPKIDLVIDLHRDALPKYLSTVTLDSKNYAKVMFVHGGKSSNANITLSNVNRMNELIKNKFPGITRGVLSRSYSIYNQDLHDNSMLIELGGNENLIDEVMNTSEFLANIIYEYLGGTDGK
jgi:stage II sporulation protein P